MYYLNKYNVGLYIYSLQWTGHHCGLFCYYSMIPLFLQQNSFSLQFLLPINNPTPIVTSIFIYCFGWNIVLIILSHVMCFNNKFYFLKKCTENMNMTGNFISNTLTITQYELFGVNRSSCHLLTPDNKNPRMSVRSLISCVWVCVICSSVTHSCSQDCAF